MNQMDRMRSYYLSASCSLNLNHLNLLLPPPPPPTNLSEADVLDELDESDEVLLFFC